MRFGLYVSLVAAGALLAACSPESTEVSKVAPPQRQESVTAVSYSAIDQLIQGSLAPIDPTHPVLVTTVVSQDELAESSPLGRLLAEEMTSRLANAGYTVHELKIGKVLSIKDGTGETMLTRNARDVSDRTGAQAIVVGTYTVGHDKVFVNVKLVRATDARILSAVDYDLTLTPDIRSLVGGNQIAVYHPT